MTAGIEMAGLTHLDADGRARVVDVSNKPDTARVAEAEGAVRMRPETLAAMTAASGPKGDVRMVAELAGIMAAKRTADLIPLCHPLALSSIKVRVEADATAGAAVVRASVATTGPTGVEMEALTAVSVACLTVYDMLKAIDRGMEIGPVRLVSKSGGASGDWRRGAD